MVSPWAAVNVPSVVSWRGDGEFGDTLEVFDEVDGKPHVPGMLVAWDPVTQSRRWAVEHDVAFNGGVLATAGNLVFQGDANGVFSAYRAATGERLWSMATGTAITAAPVSHLVDGRQHWFVAHLVVRRGWLRGPLFGAFNAQWLGPWDVAPRAHPGDGQLEVVEVTMSASERLKARRRLPLGTHVPHPGIRIRRAEAVQHDVPKGHGVWLDGERLGPAKALSIRLEPDALRIVV